MFHLSLYPICISQPLVSKLDASGALLQSHLHSKSSSEYSGTSDKGPSEIGDNLSTKVTCFNPMLIL